MESEKLIAVLCVQPQSFYKTMPGVIAFDRHADARTFAGKEPCLGHPPCRTFSRWCQNQVKAAPEVIKAERALGVWVAHKIRENGGILEQPALSDLFLCADLPLPGKSKDPMSWSIEVWQGWWGFPQIKRTWLYFSKIPPAAVNFPFRLMGRGRDKRTWQVMSQTQRAKTHPAFAEWLVEHARKAYEFRDI